MNTGFGLPFFLNFGIQEFDSVHVHGTLTVLTGEKYRHKLGYIKQNSEVRIKKEVLVGTLI